MYLGERIAMERGIDPLSLSPFVPKSSVKAAVATAANKVSVDIGALVWFAAGVAFTLAISNISRLSHFVPL